MANCCKDMVSHAYLNLDVLYIDFYRFYIKLTSEKTKPNVRKNLICYIYESAENPKGGFCQIQLSKV